MKRLLVVLALLVAGGVGLGFYRGWFQFSTAGSDEKPNATITVDKDKIEADKEKAAEKVKDLEDKAKDAAKGTPDKSKGETPKP